MSSQTWLTTASATSMVSLVTVMVFTSSFILSDTNTEVPLMVPSMVPWLSAGITSDSGMAMPVAPSALILARSSAVPLMRSFLPSKSASRSSGFLAA